MSDVKQDVELDEQQRLLALRQMDDGEIGPSVVGEPEPEDDQDMDTSSAE